MSLSNPRHRMRTLFVALGILTISWTLSFGKGVFVFADTAGTSPAVNSTTTPQSSLTNLGQAVTDRAAQEAALQQQLDQLENQIQQYQQQINTEESTKNSQQQQVNLYKQKVAQTQLEIKQVTLALQQTQLQMQQTQTGIDATNVQIDREKQNLANLIEQISQSDQTSMVQLLLRYHTFSDFFNRAESLQALDEGVKANLDALKQSVQDLQQKQSDLSDQQDSQDRLRQTQFSQEGTLKDQLSQQNLLLTSTKNRESKIIAQQQQIQQTADQIRSQLFQLQGLPIQLTFGQAYQYAVVASQLSGGVAPAFLLGELKQESNWGGNVGQCYLVDPDTGAGKRKDTGEPVDGVMKPSRDVQPFMQITQSLGRNPYATSVSCPRANGYGGGMGPAQFIPSTWLGYIDRVTQLVGHTADPWNAQDAFVASATKLASAGATAQTYNAEWKAAAIYYAGSNWKRRSDAYTYANNVMALRAQYQRQIDVLNGSGG